MMTGVTKKLLLGGVLGLLVAVPCYGKTVAPKAAKAGPKAASTAHKAKASGTRTRTGPDSFVKYRVETVEEFVAAYDGDAVLRKRLSKHFHVPETELTSMVHSQLQEVSFQESRWMGTYGVRDRSGEIYPVKTYVRKGAKALGLADGTPLFKIPCGNPFGTNLPHIEVPHPARLSSKPVEALPSIPPVGAITLEPTALQSPEEYVLCQDIPRAPCFTVPVATEGSRFFPVWLPTEGGHPNTPEPASLLLLTAGAGLLGGLARRRQRKG